MGLSYALKHCLNCLNQHCLFVCGRFSWAACLDRYSKEHNQDYAQRTERPNALENPKPQVQTHHSEMLLKNFDWGLSGSRLSENVHFARTASL